MFHPSIMHDLLQEAREKKIKTKKQLEKLVKENPKYDELKDMHVELVAKTLKDHG